MKQIKKMFLVSFLALVSLLFFASCGGKGHSHNFVKGDTVNATCTEKGYTLYKCECGESEKRDETEALGHSYGAWLVTKEPTTSQKGTREKTCTRCGDKVSEEIPVKEETHVHTYSSWEVVTNPTAEKTGLLTRNCTALDDSQTHVLPKLNENDYTIDETTLVLSTCTKAGSKEYVYTLEGQSFKFKVETPVTSHTLVESKKEATCTEAGYVKQTCSVCGYEEVETFKALGHTPVRNGHECEADKVCSVCNVVLEKKTGHKLTETLLEATCASEGKITYTCDYCDKVIEEVKVAKLDHKLSNFVDGGDELSTETTCLYKKPYVATCEKCGEKVYKYEERYHHNYELESTKLATCSNAGTLTYKCTDCHDEITKALEVDVNAHTYSLKSTSTDTKLIYECSECHDEKTVLNHSATKEATVSASDIKETKAVELSGNTSITLDDNILNNISSDVTIKADTVDTSTLSLSEENKKLIGDNPVYDFELLDSDNNHIGFNNGKATIRIPYTLKEGENPTDIGVWYINENGQTTTIKATYVDGYAVFETEHFSYYAVSKLTDSEKCELYGHHYVKSADLKATCTEDGYYSEICSVCGDIKVTKSDAIGHKFSQTSKTEATCLLSGKRVETCENCGLVKEYFIPALGHDYVLNSDKSSVATCQHGGHEEYKCSRCDDEFKTDTMQLNHQYVNTIVDPTCTTQGYTLHTCLVCNETVKDTYVSSLGHDYALTTVDPTCTEQGYTVHTCSRCNDSYKDNYVSARHTWNLETPTCGVGQECLVCHAKGLPATGNHTYENGVCTVCGDGCTHTYTETTVEATCETQGYTLKTCSICGFTEKTDITKAKGHKGNLVCDVCGKTIVSSTYVKNLLTSVMKYDSYTISGKDLKVSIKVNDTNIVVDISTITLNLKLDENGKLYGNGYVAFSETQNGTKGNATSRLYVKDDYIYMQVTESYYSNMISGDYTYKHTESTYDENSHYYKLKLDDYLKQMGISSIKDVIEAIDSDTLKKVTNALIKISTNEDYFVNKAIVSVINKLFTLDTTSNEYKLSLNLNYFIQIYEYAKTHTISEVIDYATSEGTFNKIYNFVNGLNTLTVGDVVSKVSETGLTLEEIITILNDNVPSGSLDKTFEDMINSYLNNNDQTLAQYLTSPVISSQTLITFVKNITNDSIDLTTYQSQLVQMIDAYKDMNIFDFAAPNDEAKAQIISLIDEYVNQYKDVLGLNIYTNKDGEVTKANISIKGTLVLGSSASAEVDITLNASFNSSVTIDQNIIDQIDTLYSIDFAELIQNSNIELVKDEDNNVTGFVYSYNYSYENIHNNKNYTEVVSYINKYVFPINFDEMELQFIDSDCNNWYRYYINFTNEPKGVCYQTVTRKYYDLNGNLITSGKEEGTYSTTCYTLKLFYNTKSGKIEFANDSNNPTMHNFKLTESKEASGCSEAGYNKYICSDCGYQKCEYYVNGHNNYTTTYELVNPEGDCSEGVKVIRTCSDCGKSFVDYITHSHQTKSTWELTQGATSCEDGRVWVSICEVCGYKDYNGDEVYYTHEYDYNKKVDLSKYDVNGYLEYDECKYCHTLTNLDWNIKDDPTKTTKDEDTNTQIEEYANGKVVISEKITETKEGCIIKTVTETTVKLNNTTSYSSYSSIETHYNSTHQYEDIESTDGLTKTVITKCKNCGAEDHKIINTYYDSDYKNRRIEERYDYSYDNSYSYVSYIGYSKYTYDENRTKVERIEESKYFEKGVITEYRIREYKLISNQLLETEETCIRYKNGVESYGYKYVYDYDAENCKLIVYTYDLRYEDGKLVTEELEGTRESDYHFEYVTVSKATCTQFEILECKNCHTQKEGSDPYEHRSYTYDEDGNKVCSYCGLKFEKNSDKNSLVLEEIKSENYDGVEIGYCYYSYSKHAFSNPIVSLIIDSKQYELKLDVDTVNTFSNKEIVSGIYYISLERIQSSLQDIDLSEASSIELKLEVIDGETKTNSSITISLLDCLTSN